MSRKARSSFRRRRRTPKLLDELTIIGLSRATESHIEELCYELLKDPDYQEEMLRRSKKFFALLSAGFARKLKALREARAAGARR
jgi:hypothetical protein